MTNLATGSPRGEPDLPAPHLGTTEIGPISLAEQGHFWVGVEREVTEAGTVARGQMFVQYQIPEPVRHRYPLILVHGGGGQGLDYLGTPDGRPGWATWLLSQGYAVYVVDRPGCGRSPAHAVRAPGGRLPTYEFSESLFIGAAEGHTRWPGTGLHTDPVLDQLIAEQQPSSANLAAAHHEMQRPAAELLERIGPAVIMSHSAGGPFAFLAADACPDMVVGMVVIEPVGPPFVEIPGLGGLSWGLTAVPLTFDPPAAGPEEIRTTIREPPAPGLSACAVQADPPRTLPHLKGIPTVVVTAPASRFAAFGHGIVDFLVQAGVDAELLRLEDVGITGNGHGMMLERNNLQVIAALSAWIERRVESQGGPEAPT